MGAQRILIVDDEPSVLDMCARTLRNDGFEVIAASDAQTARVLLQADVVDLLITDIRMPGESGLSLLDAVRQTNPTLPLMIITGYPEPTSIDAALNLNVKSFIVKPFNIRNFSSEVKRSLGLAPNDTAHESKASLNKLIPIIIEELRLHRVPVLEGKIQEDPDDGRIVLVPQDSGGAVPIDEFLTQYTQGEQIYLIVLPHP